MNVTAVFVYAKGCPSCDIFKSRFESSVMGKLKSMGVRVIEPYTASDMRQGLPQGITKPAFLTKVVYYPTILLMRSDIFDSAKNHTVSSPINQDLRYVFAFNQVVSENYPFFTEVRGQYSLSPTDIERFVNDFLKSDKYINAVSNYSRSDTRAVPPRNTTTTQAPRYGSLCNPQNMRVINTYSNHRR